MSAMSASPVKPVLPPGVTSSPPKVAPPNTTTSSIAPSIPSAACNLPGSPLKTASFNNSVSLSLVSDNKQQPPQPASVTVPSVQPLPRTPEKPKDAPPTGPLPLNNIAPKVTSNGVPSVATPTPVSAPVTAPSAVPASVPAPIPTPAPVTTPAQVPAPKESLSNSVPAPKESSAKQEAAPPKPAGNHASIAAIPPPPSAGAAKPEPAPAAPVVKSPTAPTCQLEKKESPLPETKPEAKAEVKVDTKTPEKPAPAPLSAAPVTPVSQPSATATASDATKTTKEETAPPPEVKTPKVPRVPKKKAEPKVATPKQADESGEERKSKRARLPTQPYQSPLPELSLITKISTKTATPTKKEDDKLIVFYKNEFLAVRNAEGSFYVCQAMQNIYRASSKIRIRWLSQDSSGVYIPDFYDHSDFECILTSLSLGRVDKDKWKLPDDERLRTENILKRALDVEKGVAEKPSVTEEHPDGLDLSLFKDESQLKKSRRSAKKASPKAKKPKPAVTPKKESEPEPTPKKDKNSKKRKSLPVKTKKAPPPPKKKTPAKTSPAKAPPAKKAAETKKVAAKRKAPKASPSTSFSSLTPAEKRRKVIENLTKAVVTNERSTKTRSAGGAVAAKISSAALKMVITKDRDRRSLAVRKK